MTRTLILVATLLAMPATAQPIRMSSSLFGETAEIEARDLPAAQAEEIVRAAFAEAASLERRLDALLAELNNTAGSGPREVDEELYPVLLRSLEFCLWSTNANGPLGGRLRQAWGHGTPLATQPSMAALREALLSGRCELLRLDGKSHTAALAADSVLDLEHFAGGWAVDRTVDYLQTRGVTNGQVAIGRVRRGFGPGPGGRGWPLDLRALGDAVEDMEQVYLDDAAAATALAGDHPLRIGGKTLSRYLDQRPPEEAPLTARPGRPAEGILATVAVTELALDAQALASSLFILGSSEGQFRLGSLKPRPAVLWLIGGARDAILTTYHWSALRQP